MTKNIYLNAVNGVKPRLLLDKKINENPQELYKKLVLEFCRLSKCKPEEVELGQNITSHITFIIDCIKKIDSDFKIMLSSHEIIYLKQFLEQGKMIAQEATYPNYAKANDVNFSRMKTQIFDPIAFSKSPEKFISGKTIIVLSHVSRLTGEIFPIKQIYKKIKKTSPESILIVDGAQFTGTDFFKIPESCDAYIGMTSKFIGAEPNISIAYISSELRKRFIKNYPKINPQEYVRELFSAVQELSSPEFKKDILHKIKQSRNFLLKELKQIKTIKIASFSNQAPQIVTISVGNISETKRIVEELEKQGIEVSHNLDWSITEPEIPLIRIAITVKTTKEELKEFAKVLKKIKE
ncbi:MAG: aminotransferase class V-fold PLP-dependent enzyme [archaeon]|nr:aminotransferase class V-fold PLP-dependent enzyme [archaeon]